MGVCLLRSKGMEPPPPSKHQAPPPPKLECLSLCFSPCSFFLTYIILCCQVNTEFSQHWELGWVIIVYVGTAPILLLVSFFFSGCLGQLPYNVPTDLCRVQY